MINIDKSEVEKKSVDKKDATEEAQTKSIKKKNMNNETIKNAKNGISSNTNDNNTKKKKLHEKTENHKKNEQEKKKKIEDIKSSPQQNDNFLHIQSDVKSRKPKKKNNKFHDALKNTPVTKPTNSDKQDLIAHTPVSSGSSIEIKILKEEEFLFDKKEENKKEEINEEKNNADEKVKNQKSFEVISRSNTPIKKNQQAVGKEENIEKLEKQTSKINFSHTNSKLEYDGYVDTKKKNEHLSLQSYEKRPKSKVETYANEIKKSEKSEPIKKNGNGDDSFFGTEDKSFSLFGENNELLSSDGFKMYKMNKEQEYEEEHYMQMNSKKQMKTYISVDAQYDNNEKYDLQKFKKSVKSLQKAVKKYFAEIWKRNITIKKEIFENNEQFTSNNFQMSEVNLNNSTTTELMTQLPLRFKDSLIEELYVLNLNGWISSRMIIIGFLMLCLCILIWPLCIWSFKTSNTWNSENYVTVLFHVCMAVNIILLFFFIIIGFTQLRKYAEALGYVLFSLMIGVWGTWNIISSATLKDDFTYKLIPGLSSAVETINTLTYIYGVLPLVIMDVFFPSRTQYNWILHVIFVFLNSGSVMTVGIMNPNFVPASYVVFRIVAYTTLCGFLYIGCYTCELQTRYVFYHLLITGYKLDKVRYDLNKFKKDKKFASAIEELMIMIKECNKVSLEVKNDLDTNVSIHRKMSYCHNMLQDCLSILTKSDNLYNVDYYMFDKLESKKFIEAYVSKKNTGFFEEDINKAQKSKLYYSESNCACAHKGGLGKKEIKDFLKTVNVCEIKNQMEKIKQKELNNWDFNCIEYFSKSKSAFFDIALSLFRNITNKIATYLIVNFLCFVENQYTNVPYHNIMHAAMVAQKFFCLSQNLGISGVMDTKIKLVMFIASICHDVGHPGFNNLFFVNSYHPLSILYNDISVLENYHASITFKILKMSQCNILKAFTDKDFRVMRLYIIELILCTDMQYHFEHISKFRVRRTNADFDFFKNNEDLLVVIKMLIKSADVSHGTVKWAEHYKWCQRVLAEFYAQGDEETINKLPVSPLCDRKKHNDVSKSQLTFLKYVVMPLYIELTHIDNNKFIEKLCIKRLNDNCHEWENLARTDQIVEVFNQNKDETQKMKNNYLNNKKHSYIDLSLLFVRDASEAEFQKI